MQDDVLKAVARKLVKPIFGRLADEWNELDVSCAMQALHDMGLGELLAAGSRENHAGYCYSIRKPGNRCNCGKTAWDAAKAKVLS